MKAVIYARYSSDRQRAESIEDQVRVCTEFAKREGHEIVKVYSDEAKSGTSDERPSYQKMIADAKKAKWELIVVYKLDRFARNRYDSAFYRHELQKCGVKVVSATEAYSDGPEGVLLEGLLESLAEYYSKQLGQNAKRGMRGNALKCKANGVTLYGYDIDEEGNYVVNEQQAQVVRAAFQMVADRRATVREVKEHMTHMGARTAHGHKPNDCMVRNMLKNPKYKGTYVWDDVEVEDGMPAIVDKHVWHAAQGKWKPRPKEHRADYWLSGRAMCEDGTMMHGESAKNGQYHYYRCKTCRAYMRQEELEAIAVDALRYVLTDKVRAKIVDDIMTYLSESEESTALKNARKRLAALDRSEDRIVDAIAEGLISNEKARQKMDALRAEREQLQAVEADLSPTLDAVEVADALEAFALNVPADSELARPLVNRVVVSPETVTVVFNIAGAPPSLVEIEAQKKEKPAAQHVSTGDYVWQTAGRVMRTIIAPTWFAIVTSRKAA